MFNDFKEFVSFWQKKPRANPIFPSNWYEFDWENPNYEFDGYVILITEDNRFPKRIFYRSNGINNSIQYYLAHKSTYLELSKHEHVIKTIEPGLVQKIFETIEEIKNNKETVKIS